MNKPDAGGSVFLQKSGCHLQIRACCASVRWQTNSLPVFGGILKGYRKAIMQIERNANPDYVGYHAVESLITREMRISWFLQCFRA